MITKYKAIFSGVIKVEILKETEKQVTINNLNCDRKPIREAKETYWYKYCNTYDEAVQFLVNSAELEVAKYNRYLKQANEKLEKVKSLYKKKGTDNEPRYNNQRKSKQML